MWGLITVLVDSLIPRLREIFELTYFQAGLVQFAFFIAYGLFSIPSGNLLHRIGYKRGIIVGLAVMGTGCLLFLPAASLRIFPLFMLAYFTLAGGMTLLQVAANPYVTVLGDERGASSRLNLAQAFNSLGTTIAPAIGAVFILSDNIKSSSEIELLGETAKESYYAAEAMAVQKPFFVLALALILLAVFVALVKLPGLLNTSSHKNYRQALHDRKLKFGAVGIFLYVGAEVAIGSYLVNYFLDMHLAEVIRSGTLMSSIVSAIQPENIHDIDDKAVVGTFVMFYWGSAMTGRFIGAYLTRIFSPNIVLSVFSMAAILFIGISMAGNGLVALWSVVLVGLFNSIMFPTIFSIAIEDLGDLKPLGSGILVTAIAGGAFIPPLYGYFTDLAGFRTAFLLLMACYAYIMIYGIRAPKLNPLSS